MPFSPLLDRPECFQILAVLGAVRRAFHFDQIVQPGKIDGCLPNILSDLVLPDHVESYTSGFRVNVEVEYILAKEYLFLESLIYGQTRHIEANVTKGSQGSAGVLSSRFDEDIEVQSCSCVSVCGKRAGADDDVPNSVSV